MTAQKIGHAFYAKPIRFKDSPNGSVSSFSTTFVFAIHSPFPILSGHGMAFVVAPKTSLPFATSGHYLGLFNFTNNGNEKNHVFAVELDTISNFEFSDPNNNHVGIDINSLKSVQSSHAGWWDEKGQFNHLTLMSHKPMQVWLDYDGPSHRIDVSMAPFRKSKPTKPLVSIVKDLSSVLLQDMFVGFSSATGSFLSEHFVLGWSFGVNGKAPPLSKLPKLPKFKEKDIFYKNWMLKRKFAEELEDWETDFKKNRLKFKDLYYATKGFKEKDLLGSGGFGSVYKGVMPKTQQEIAVKRVSNESQQGLKEFVSEIVSIDRMSHRNLVPLLGYCRRKNELILVHDYMPNGSLDKYLYNTEEVTLGWKQRIKVINGVASALFFLHEEWEQVVIHRDVKAGNVLLDAEYNGRLGDFGLARLCGHGSDPQTTRVAGTWGYLAPDHVRTGCASTATDVFAFGVLLLEVACGRRPIEIQNESGERIFLVDWVIRFWIEGKILDAKDPNLGMEYDQREVEMVLKLGLMCSHSEPHVRPSMRQVIHYLRGDAMLPDLSPLDLHGRGIMGIHHGFSELDMFTSASGMLTGGSSIVDSILSGGSKLSQSSSQILNFTYNGFHPPLADISLQGLATVTPNGLLKLTNTALLKTGHAFYTKPIRFKDSPNGTVSSFSTTFVFAIHPPFPITSYHGIAFVVASNPSLLFATSSHYLGLFNFTNNGNEKNHVFAVELDTDMTPEFNDPNDNHVGIDINSLISVKSSPAGYWNEKGQFKNLTLISGKPMQVWVDYDGFTHQIDVSMAPFRKSKPARPLVSISRDISSVLLQDMFVGFSSANNYVTGTATSYLLGWSFGVNGKAPPLSLSKLPKLPRWEPRRIYIFYKNWMLSISIFFIPLVFIPSLIFLVNFILTRRRKFAEELEDWETKLGKNHRLKYKDLYYATKGFKDNDLLGSGCFGSVYKGVMPKTEKEIAVKRVSNTSRQGLKEFVAEIVSIGRMSHRNIVPLLSYCRRKNELLLVYDYMPNGSLDKYLYNSPEVTLDWKQRINVIRGVASALFYLHVEWEQVVIHRDVKASNVLLDAELNGRLGDFGLARLCGHGSDPQTTRVAGTWGYLDPDHIKTGRATIATDVFAFGVLLLEVACGRRPIEIDDESGERILLVDWVFRFWVEGNILDAKDPNLGTEYDQREVEIVLKLGLLCSNANPQARPSMGQVLHWLSGDEMLPELSPSDLCSGGMILGIHHGLSEFDIVPTTIVDSILSGGR
ncbi:hypothetical protein AALP_AA6G031500 [Arabis alpina]|uniref:non-specific serine/threonine protein kinase n=1 Tax=Arabis alpina TaxID=50452 RepID=A0A087GLT0_ARAAL|nr:hypothetical protein AALP_AA6G031500 [Arabis alpina]